MKTELFCTWCDKALVTGAAPVRHGMIPLVAPRALGYVCDDLCMRALVACCDDLLDRARKDFASLRAETMKQEWWVSRRKEEETDGD